MTSAEVAERCEEHAMFLLSQMRKPGEPVRWTHTTFYRWLVDKCRVCENIDALESTSDVSSISMTHTV